jgi:TonB-dependent SusC/RagA subfamily outer membrane receptor
VARIEVLKDAADLAAYGMSAANGVIRITTRRPGSR